ncbi:MAG: SPOR domain-containing protein [Woeseiaceae bacterium]
MPLPGQADQDIKTVVLDRDRSNPVPSNGDSEPAEPTPEPVETREEPKPEPVAARPAPQPVAEETPAEEPEQAAAADTSATGMWDVQYGAYSDQEKAEKIAADLRKQGYSAFFSPVTTSSGRLFRVRIGPHEDRDTAESVAAKLKAEGHDVKVMPR